MNRKNLTVAFRSSLPVMAGYIVLGIGFGILLSDLGYGAPWAFFSALTIYAGSMQYAALDLISGGAGLITTALMTLMINARHFFYGLSMLEKYDGMGPARPYLIFGLTDETYSLVCFGAPDGTEPRHYYFFLTLFDQLWWILGCTIGGLLGPIIPFDTTGLDFAMTALFVVIFVGQWQSVAEESRARGKNPWLARLPAAIGVGESLICLLILGASRFVIPSMVLITLTLTALRRVLDREEPSEEVEPNA